MIKNSYLICDYYAYMLKIFFYKNEYNQVLQSKFKKIKNEV